MTYAIKLENVTKKYKMYDSSKDRFLDLFTPKEYGRDFYALKNIDFTAESGDVIGFVGINGSGKSTLSNIISGIVPETTGEVEINGQVSLIAVAAGLKNDLTGRENIELKLLMLGFSKKDIILMEEDIITFSELEEFIDQPVKSYSSGMKSRLGFAISVNIDPDILVIDEALSVGDKAFSDKSFKKMNEFKEAGKTMIFVSHSLGQMRKFCNKILWLEYGQVKRVGLVDEVMDKYEEFLRIWQKMSLEQREEYRTQSRNTKAQVDISQYDLYSETEKEELYKRVSLLAHFNSLESIIHSPQIENEEKVSSDEYKDKVYYITLKMEKNLKEYYLLSNEKSSKSGLVGWVESKYLNVKTHIEVEEMEESVIIKEDSKLYTKPWGGKKQEVVVPKEITKTVVKVVKCDLVGGNLWYKVNFNSNEYWIHNSFIDENRKG